uniref:Disks large 1 tumor suppressor protein n=2 Tax=Bactrocera latifrons TaxID=174628 RepID=A0A0K8VTJ2_BACLA
MDTDSERERSSDPNLLTSSDNHTFHDDDDDDDDDYDDADSSAPEYGEDIGDMRDIDFGSISDVVTHAGSDVYDIDDDDDDDVDDDDNDNARTERTCLLVSDAYKVRRNRRSKSRQHVKRRLHQSLEREATIPLNTSKKRNYNKGIKATGKYTSEEDEEQVPLKQNSCDERQYEQSETDLGESVGAKETTDSYESAEVYTVQVIKISGNLGDSSVEDGDIDEEPFKSLDAPDDDTKNFNETIATAPVEFNVQPSTVVCGATQVSAEIDAKYNESSACLEELTDCAVPTAAHASFELFEEEIAVINTKVIEEESASDIREENDIIKDYQLKEFSKIEQHSVLVSDKNVNDEGDNDSCGGDDLTSSQCLTTAPKANAINNESNTSTTNIGSVLADEENWRDSVRESIECYYSAQDLLEYGHLLSSGLKTPDIESGYFEKSESDISRDENEVYTNNLSNRIRQRSFSKSYNTQLTNMSESLRFELNRFKTMIESIERERIYGQTPQTKQNTFESVTKAEESYNIDMEAEVTAAADAVAEAVSITVIGAETVEMTNAMDVDEEEEMDVEGAVGGDDDTRGYWSTVFGQASQIEETTPEMTLDERFADIQKAHRALELLEDYHSRLSEPQDRALRIAIERVIRIFKSRLFQALLDIQEFYELTLLDDSKTIQQKTAETLQIASKWEQDGHAIKIADNQRMKVDGDADIPKESAGVSASGTGASEGGSSSGAKVAARSPESAPYQNRQQQQQQPNTNVDTVSSEAVSVNVYNNNKHNSQCNSNNNNNIVSNSDVCITPIYHFNCLQMGN